MQYEKQLKDQQTGNWTVMNKDNMHGEKCGKKRQFNNNNDENNFPLTNTMENSYDPL